MPEDDEAEEPSTSEEAEPDIEPGPPAWSGAKPKQAAFLTALVFHGGLHNKAAKSAKIARRLHYYWMESDANYHQLHEQAMRQVTEVLEDEAIRRAKDGVRKGVYYQGEECGQETIYSDGLMMFLLRAAAPEKYRERSEVSGKVDVTHKFSGTMEELLQLYRKVISEPQDEPHN